MAKGAKVTIGSLSWVNTSESDLERVTILPWWDHLVTVEKLSLSFEPGLAERVREAAVVPGRSLSAFVAEAVEYHLKIEEARRVLQDWETEHGPITEKELARVRSRWRA